MIRRLLTWVAVLATIGTAVLIANAIAQGTHAVKAVDPLGDPPATTSAWDPDEFAAEPDDTVSFEFDQAGIHHNVVIRPPNDELPMNEGLIELSAEVPTCDGPLDSCPPGHDPIPYTLGDDVEEGNYLYICTLHAGYSSSQDEWVGMVGTIGEADPDPDPYVPNPTEFAPPWEIGTEPPRMLGVQANGVRRGVRLRMRLTHPGRVNVRLRRGGRQVLNRQLKNLREGVNRRNLQSNRLTRGRYTVILRGWDKWGQRTKPKVVRRQVRLKR